MAICQLFLHGRCRLGDKCKKKHPNEKWLNQTDFTQTLFIETMIQDLTLGTGKPLWPLSVYSSSHGGPCLFTNLDESPEELRVRAVTATKSGILSEYLKYESEKLIAAGQIYDDMRSTIQARLNSNGSTDASLHTGVSSPKGYIFAPKGSASASTVNWPSSTTPPKPSFGQSTSTHSPFGSSGFSQAENPGSSSTFGQSAQSKSALTQPTSGFEQTSLGVFRHNPSGQSVFGNVGTSGGRSTGEGGLALFAGLPYGIFGPYAAALNPSSATAGGYVFGKNSPPHASHETPAQGTSAFGSPFAYVTGMPAHVSAFAPNASVSAGYAFGVGGSSAAVSTLGGVQSQ